MSNSVQPQRRQPTRLPLPWDSLGKNTGVGCHFLLQCMKVKSESEVSQSCPTLSDPMGCSLLGSSIHGIFQARIQEWVTIAFSDIMCVCVCVCVCIYIYICKTIKKMNYFKFICNILLFYLMTDHKINKTRKLVSNQCSSENAINQLFIFISYTNFQKLIWVEDL